jgi:hypothetical protein
MIDLGEPLPGRANGNRILFMRNFAEIGPALLCTIEQSLPDPDSRGAPA